MNSNNHTHFYVLQNNQQLRRGVRRVHSVGDAGYGLISSAQAPVLTNQTRIIAHPVLLHQTSLQNYPNQAFSPYQVSRRPRSNSDNSPTIVMMQSVIPNTAVIPTYTIANDQTLSGGNAANNCCVSRATKPTGAEIPSTSTDSCSTPPKNTKEKRVLCDNCGVASSNFNNCANCRKRICGNATKVKLARQRLTGSSDNREKTCSSNGLPSSSFYNGGESDFSRYLRQTNNFVTVRNQKNLTRKRTNLGKTKEPSVCITISSDSSEDEEQNLAASASSSTNVTGELSASCVDEVPKKRAKQDVCNDCSGPAASESTLDPVVEHSDPAELEHLRLSDRDLLKTTMNVKVNHIRLGQMKLLPRSVLRISNQNLTMTAHCSYIGTDVILDIPWHGVVNCDLCDDLREPCLYLVLDPSFLPKLRENLQMEKGKYPYYDPGGGDDERLFIFYVNPSFLTLSTRCNVTSLWKKMDLIRKKMKRSMSFIRRITFEESGSRQSAAASVEANVATPCDKTLSKEASAFSSTSCDIATTTDVPSSASGHRILTRNQTKSCDDSSKSEDLKLMFSGPRVKLFVYPPPPANGGIQVMNDDQFCLNKGEFLNDVIIDFYLKYVFDQILSPRDRERSHVFSCFFYDRLMQKSTKKNKETSAAERRHGQVKKWTRNIDLFSKDFIFVPINEASHWYLAVVCFPAMCGMETPHLSMNDNTSSTEKNGALPSSMKYLTQYGCNEEEPEVEGQSVSVQEVGCSKHPEISNSSVENSKGSKCEDFKTENYCSEDKLATCLGGQKVSSLQHPKQETNVCLGGVDENSEEVMKEKDKLIKITISKYDEKWDLHCDAASTSDSTTEMFSEGSSMGPENNRNLCSMEEAVSTKVLKTNSNILTSPIEENSETSMDVVEKNFFCKSSVTDSPNTEGSESLNDCLIVRHTSPAKIGDGKLEICLSPGGPPFTLSKELQKKCKISPNKTPQVKIPRIEKQNSVDASKHCETDLKTCSPLHSCDESVIVLSSPERQESDRVQGMRKSLDFFQSKDDSINSPSQVPSVVSRKDSEASLHLFLETSTHELSNLDPSASDSMAFKPVDDTVIPPKAFATSNNVYLDDQMVVTCVSTVNTDEVDEAKSSNGSVEVLERKVKVDTGQSTKSKCFVNDKSGVVENELDKETAVSSLDESPSKRAKTSTSNTALDISEVTGVLLRADSKSEMLHSTDSTVTNINNDIASSSSNMADRGDFICPVTDLAKCDTETSGRNADPGQSNADSSAVDINSSNDSWETERSQIYRRPCILVFDSLRGPSRSKTAANLREYLTEEWKMRKHMTDGEKLFNKDTLKMCSTAVPQQDNFSDCGIFLLHYVEKFFSNPIKNFSTPIKDLVNWFDPAECKRKRDEIKEIIQELHEDWIARNAK